MRQDGDINWSERESSLQHHVRSNVKHKTKENAPGQKIIESVIVAYYLSLSQTIPELW